MTKSYPLLLPNEPIFHRLIENSRLVTGTIVHDPTCHVDAGYRQLLQDVLALRQCLYKKLPASAFDAKGVIVEDEPYIFILSPGNYEFIVAVFAVLACGGAVVPLAPGVLPAEAHYFANECRSSVILASSRCWEQSQKISQHLEAQGHPMTVVPISPAKRSPFSPVADFRIEVDESLLIAQSRPSLILYTSGTTGPPKAVVQLRPYFAHGYGTSPSDVFLTHRPPHWIGGLRSIIGLVLSGTKQEVIEPHEEVIWERLRKGGVTIMCCLIPLWCKLMKHYKEVLSYLTEAELQGYLKGIRGVRMARVGGAAPMPSLLRFWRETIGIHLEVSYGSTETGGPGMTTNASCDRNLEGSVGMPDSGVLVKLSKGDHGEILIKSSYLFAGYLGDERQTRAAFTPDGFYKTGDYGRRVRGQYIIEGRAAADFVRFHAYRVPILEVESKLLELPFVSEACIVSVPDERSAARVAAIVRFHQDFPGGNLHNIREALSDKLSQYKLPTALRVLQEGEEIPTTLTGKVMRRLVVERFFQLKDNYELPSEVELLDIQSQKQVGGNAKAWDWAGLQVDS
ncbi:hypothetical protein BDV23DRAFT_190022 [Aspergillus alliaceus]|uniref:AMP-dependent synthetase/ligase domain-containing protein n=1 Tax=Petromyces alliaceus TaxID=209559 RepID=A0A5N7CKP8_PETAA|nr:hypothetical protein BDV23DRAFT_190022 [Aspergillus alliaceus]